MYQNLSSMVWWLTLPECAFARKQTACGLVLPDPSLWIIAGIPVLEGGDLGERIVRHEGGFSESYWAKWRAVRNLRVVRLQWTWFVFDVLRTSDIGLAILPSSSAQVWMDLPDMLMRWSSPASLECKHSRLLYGTYAHMTSTLVHDGTWTFCLLHLWESYSHRLSPDQGIIFSFFRFVFHAFSCFISFSDHVKLSFSCFSFSNYVKMSFSCAVNIIMFILVPFLHLAICTCHSASKMNRSKIRNGKVYIFIFTYTHTHIYI